jgi:hypothetical protein
MLEVKRKPPPRRTRAGVVLAERLRLAVALRGMTVYRLECLLRDQGVRGSSHGAMQRYLLGATPSLEFVAAAATVLDVRKGWLAFGEGPLSDHAEPLLGVGS